jgi:hypothetical protein
MVNNCNIAYDIVRQQTMLYVSIQCRTSAYDVVRQHTMSSVSIRCRMSASDVVRQHTMSYVSIRCRTSVYDIAYDMQYVGDSMGAAGGDLTKKSVQAFLALIFEASEARSFVILDVFEGPGLKENVVAWTDSTRDQRAACTSRRACVHVARWRFAAQLRAGEGCIHVMPFFIGAGRAIISCTTG